MPEHPFVSVLVAARNEAHNLPHCLESLASLDYPAARFEVLIGNDHSTDETGPIAREFCLEHANFQVVDIETQLPNLNGKANVLAQLADRATGDFLFITDADVRLPRTWLTGLLAQFGPQTGIVTGTTLVQGRGLWARLQAIDWLLAFGLIHLGTRLKWPLTGSGNNMAVRRVAYEAVGGFRGVPFSVVEDYTLFQAVVGRGYGFGHALGTAVLAQTLPAPTLAMYLQQRKRWMRGAFSLPLPLLVGVVFQYLLVPVLLMLSLASPRLALAIYVAKLMFQSTLLGWVLHRTRQGHRWFDALLFEPYQVIMGVVQMLYYWLPVPIRWKGRTYR